MAAESMLHLKKRNYCDSPTSVAGHLLSGGLIVGKALINRAMLTLPSSPPLTTQATFDTAYLFSWQANDEGEQELRMQHPSGEVQKT